MLPEWAQLQLAPPCVVAELLVQQDRPLWDLLVCLAEEWRSPQAYADSSVPLGLCALEGIVHPVREALI